MIGTKLAHFTIAAHLGSGGMGDVYQATDSKLGRSVAIKLLPEAFVQDHERAALFDREARILASLNHPNIAGIHSLEEASGARYLVLELVEGETLANRIKRGPVPIDEALNIATSICEALEAAHEKGVVHRDLKPANVKITPYGKVKVLDFGLAKVRETEQANARLSNSPTLLSGSTPGMIMGTAAYMSQEQARGKEVDRRTDIFAFGAVLYEMLTGCQAFGGEDIADILSAVMKSEPDWNLLPGTVPSAIQKLLCRRLQKDPKKRRQTATDVRMDIEDALAEPMRMPSVAVPARGSRMGWIAFAGLLLVTAMLAVPAMRHLRETQPLSPPETRTDIVTPTTTDRISLALSPDGKQIVFVASGDGASRLSWDGRAFCWRCHRTWPRSLFDARRARSPG